MGIRNITIKKQMSAKSFYNGYLTKPHWKYIRFSNKMEDEGPSKQQKAMTLKKRMARQKHWQLQLLRISSLPSEG